MCLAVPGEVVRITCPEGIGRSGRVSFGGIVKEINLAFVPEAEVGQYVLVHAGFAIRLIDEAEATRILDDLALVSELAEPGADP